MKTIICTVLIVASVALNVAAQVPDPSDHQITGRVVEATKCCFVLEKGKQRLEMGLAGWVKWDKLPKAGDIVTVYYIKGRARGGAPSYTAEKVEIKDTGGSNKN
jgi:RNase P/RNase MRP subunit p29